MVLNKCAKRKWTMLVVFVGLIFSIYAGGYNINTNRGNINTDDGIYQIQASASHISILIDSDAAFTSENGVISGDGTPGNPFLIDGWEIDGLHGDYGIKLENTLAYAIIRNCDITNCATGIWLDHADNVVIENCIIHDLEGDNGGNATVGYFAEVGENVYGIRSDYGDNLNIINNQITNLVAGNGGNGYPNSNHDYGRFGGSANGIYLSHTTYFQGNVTSNKISKIYSGSGGNSVVSVSDTSGSMGGTGGSVYGFYSSRMVGSISNNILNQLYSGNGGDGGDAGDTFTGTDDGKKGGSGAAGGFLAGITVMFGNQYQLYYTSDNDYSKISENSVSELHGGKGGDGGEGGDASGFNTGGDGGKGGGGGDLYSYAVDNCQCINLHNNLAFNLYSGLFGLGGPGGYSDSFGNYDVNGNPAQMSGFKLDQLVDVEVENNTVYGMFHHPHDPVGYNYGLNLKYGENLRILGNNFEADLTAYTLLSIFLI